jgi:hypothetical protein
MKYLKLYESFKLNEAETYGVEIGKDIAQLKGKSTEYVMKSKDVPFGWVTTGTIKSADVDDLNEMNIDYVEEHSAKSKMIHQSKTGNKKEVLTIEFDKSTLCLIDGKTPAYNRQSYVLNKKSSEENQEWHFCTQLIIKKSFADMIMPLLQKLGIKPEGLLVDDQQVSEVKKKYEEQSMKAKKIINSQLPGFELRGNVGFTPYGWIDLKNSEREGITLQAKKDPLEVNVSISIYNEETKKKVEANLEDKIKKIYKELFNKEVVKITY